MGIPKPRIDAPCVTGYAQAHTHSVVKLTPPGQQKCPQSGNGLTLQQRRKATFRANLSLNCGQLEREARDAQNPFRQSECRDLAEKFDILESLGQGTTGVVYRARWRGNEELIQDHVALKVMRMDDEEMLRIARDEYDMLRSIEHPHVIKAVDFFTLPTGAVLVLDYFAGQSLDVIVERSQEGKIEEGVARVLFEALLDAVAHLHQHGIIHRDVKAQNILVSRDMKDLKLVDFNTAKRVREGALTMTGTADYMPPEVLLGESLSEKSDIWACGLCLYLMLCGSLPLERRLFGSHAEFGREIETSPLSTRSAWISSKDSISEPCKTMIEQCLITDPAQRPCAQALLNGDWVKGRCEVVDHTKPN